MSSVIDQLFGENAKEPGRYTHQFIEVGSHLLCVETIKYTPPDNVKMEPAKFGFYFTVLSSDGKHNTGDRVFKSVSLKDKFKTPAEQAGKVQQIIRAILGIPEPKTQEDFEMVKKRVNQCISEAQPARGALVKCVGKRNKKDTWTEAYFDPEPGQTQEDVIVRRSTMEDVIDGKPLNGTTAPKIVTGKQKCTD